MTDIDDLIKRLRNCNEDGTLAEISEDDQRHAADALETLRAQLNEAREDAERLDWLIHNEVQVWEVNRRYSVHEVTEHHAITGEFMTARLAIDAARQQQG